MHWLEERLHKLREILEENLTLCDKRDKLNSEGHSDELIKIQDKLSKLRRKQREESNDLTDLLASRNGVSGAFLASDGLLMAASGKIASDLEPFAAISQQFASFADEATERLALGTRNQMVLIGSEEKLALLFIGAMTIGIVCPREVVLGSVLAEPLEEQQQEEQQPKPKPFRLNLRSNTSKTR